VALWVENITPAQFQHRRIDGAAACLRAAADAIDAAKDTTHDR